METPSEITSPISSPPNNAVLAALITAGCLGVGGGAVYFLTGKSKTEITTQESASKSDVIAIKPAETTTPIVESPPVESLPNTQEPAPTEPPTKLLKQLIRSLITSDQATAKALLGQSLSAEEWDRLTTAMQSRRIRLDSNRPVTDVGSEGAIDRWAINLVHPETKETVPCTIDFEINEDSQWSIAKVVLPEFLLDSPQTKDVLAQADAFIDHLVSQSFEDIREVALEESVPNERLAALGIIFQEGDFAPIENSPLLTTSINEDRAWVIARVKSKAYDVQSEVGLEMKKVGDEWLIERVNLSRLMNEFTRVADAGETPQAPLVSTPSGGESIVVYFNYDDDQLTPRSVKQLAIIASLLKNDPDKAIRIAGHTDALGADEYNDRLSLRRARRVAVALGSLGVRGKQVNLEAFGEHVPLSPNENPDGSDNPEGRKKNRRTELYLDF